jgi:hypothetical protein
MKSSNDFHVFGTWRDAPEFAFGKANGPSLIPADDKEAYWRIFEELVDAAETAVSSRADRHHLTVRPRPYSRRRGARGHRPTDLWVSVHGASAEATGRMPQVYAIASAQGLEVGFAASINESDYHDPAVKARNRLIVPLINSKLPAAADPVTVSLQQRLTDQGGWHLNAKNRLAPGQPGFDRFGSLAGLFDLLRSNGDAQGGGVICRTFALGELAQLDLTAELALALQNFAPLISRCAPDSWETEILETQSSVDKLASAIKSFDPADVVDGRKKQLAEVARRQGQSTFRNQLMLAYQGACAITGTSVPAVLQAAHITPYLGPQTNHVTNGLLLRADIHNLFDLKLIRIDPASMCVAVSPALAGTGYAALDGVALRQPVSPAHRPSLAAVTTHFTSAPTRPLPQNSGTVPVSAATGGGTAPAAGTGLASTS